MTQLSSAQVQRSRDDARAALSELFLDSELDERALRRLRDILLATGLSLDEIEYIYFEELAPLLHWNLALPAGEWSGFDRGWLNDEIARNSRRRSIAAFPLCARIRRLWVTRSTIDDWKKLRTALSDLISA